MTQGSRRNYGKSSDCRRFTLRLYTPLRTKVEHVAAVRKISVADAMILLAEIALLMEIEA